MGYEHVVYKTRCPHCRGKVEYWFFDGDCRGNPASGGIQCDKCKRSFTDQEWNVIAKEEMKERKISQARGILADKARVLASEIERQPQILLQLAKVISSGGDCERLQPFALAVFNGDLLDYARRYDALLKLLK